jgi:hypothetical protein
LLDLAALVWRSKRAARLDFLQLNYHGWRPSTTTPDW